MPSKRLASIRSLLLRICLIAFVMGISCSISSEVLANGDLVAASKNRQRFVRSSTREIPVAANVDIVVVGGSEGGVAAAWTAARAGSSVLVLSGNYFFSDDVCAKARYWLEADEVPQFAFAKQLFGLQSGRSNELHPAQYKRHIERLLLDAGVAFHFNSQPAGVLVDGKGTIAGVITANKAGLQAVVAKAVIDATPTGAVARMAGAAFTPWSVRRVPVSRVCFEANVPGGRKIGRFCEYTLDAPMTSGSWPERCRAEVLLREQFNKVDAKRAHAHRLHMIEPSCIESQAPTEITAWPGADQLNLACCQPQGIANLYVIGQATDVPRTCAEKLTRPVHLADLGARIGEQAHQQATSRLVPTSVSVRSNSEKTHVDEMDVSEVLTGHRRYVREKLPCVKQPETAIPVWGDYDIVVVGGGTAGLPAAIAAAQSGARVLIVEMLGLLGGNRELGTPGYWKGYPHGFNRHQWRAAEAFREARKAGVDIWYNTLACGAIKQDNRVRGVAVATHMGRGAVLGKIIIDATGDADVCAAAGAQFSYLNDGDLCIQEASFRDVNLYANVLPFDHADVHSLTMHHVLARLAGDQKVWDYYPMVALRETRLVHGDYVVNVLDQIIERTYSDLIGVAWSAYDPHGFHTSDYIYAGLMPPTKHETKPGFATYLPLRSLLPAGLEGIMVVGRCHSVTHDVQASVRMNADLINEGYAAGYTAAQALKTNTPLRQVDLAPIQDHLAEIGNISAEDRDKRCVDTPEPTDPELEQASRDPSTKLQMATLLRAGQRSLPHLQASFSAKPTLSKAKALCVLGDNSAVPYLIAWLDEQPLGKGLAYQWDAFLSVPEVDGVMWLLGATHEDRAVPALVRKLNQCGTDGDNFSHIRAVATALGRIGNDEAAPALHQFLNRKGIAGYVDVAGKPESLRSETFVKSYVELYLAGALVRCGDHQGLGVKTLTAYLDDWRGIFVRYAGHVLAEEKGS